MKYAKITLFALVFALVATMSWGGLAPKTEAQSAEISAFLRHGSRGTEVTKLQTFLAQNPQIYPEGLVTGYFGPLTRSAVIQFQLAKGIEADGLVGPVTRSKINPYLSANVGLDLLNPTVTNDAVTTTSTTATITWMTNESARGMVYYSTTPITGGDTESAQYGFTMTGTSVAETGFSTSHSITLSNLTPNTTYYYNLVSIDAYDNVTITLKTTFRTN